MRMNEKERVETLTSAGPSKNSTGNGQTCHAVVPRCNNKIPGQPLPLAEGEYVKLEFPRLCCNTVPDTLQEWMLALVVM